MPALPVVVVPGIMGTRLADGRGRVVWDPDPSGGKWAAAKTVLGVWPHRDALMNVGVTLRPATGTGHIPSRDRLAARRVPGAGGLVWGAYNYLITALAHPSFSRKCGGGVRVYACGYDWRLTTRQAAGLLAFTVARALKETGAKRVVIVAHSMGGLVARWFCGRSWSGIGAGHAVTAGVVFLGSPSHGAPQMYRLMRQTFVPADQFADIDLGEALAPDTTEGLAVARLLGKYIRYFPGAYELLPTKLWCSAHPNWVRWSPTSTRLRDASDPDLLYADPFAGVSGRPSLLANRRSFDRTIGTYMPPRSTILYSSGLPTESLYGIESTGRLRRIVGRGGNVGDGTVPAWSGAARGMTRTGMKRRDLKKVSHGGLANHPAGVMRVLATVFDYCNTSRPVLAGSRLPSLARSA